PLHRPKDTRRVRVASQVESASRLRRDGAPANHNRRRPVVGLRNGGRRVEPRPNPTSRPSVASVPERGRRGRSDRPEPCGKGEGAEGGETPSEVPDGLRVGTSSGRGGGVRRAGPVARLVR